VPSALQMHGPLPPGRAGWERAVRVLADPATRAAALGPFRAPVMMSNHDPLANWFELIARPLWGLAPLAAGGGTAPAALSGTLPGADPTSSRTGTHGGRPAETAGPAEAGASMREAAGSGGAVAKAADAARWARLRAALTAAVDPDHQWYIREPVPVDQRLVEAAAVGYALAIVPDQVWEPLTGSQRDQLVRWLSTAYHGEVADNNWHFFPVFVGLGLDRVGVRRDRSVEAAHLARIAEFARVEGWYEDGPGGRVDYYNPFAFHWYGLQYAALTGDDRYVATAVGFAGQFARWFAADGSAVPYGRSLAYRFAQGAFWGALAVANVPALGWAEVRGLAQRHLEWWWRQPVLDETGGLTVGYRYPNHALVEQYITAGSPYWALKFFAPLALAAGHPFWTVEPAPPARGRVEVGPQPGARAVLARDEDGDVVRLNGQARNPWGRNGQATYAKLAYGTLAGFSVASPGPGPACAAPDGTLLLSEQDGYLRGRDGTRQASRHGDTGGAGGGGPAHAGGSTGNDGASSAGGGASSADGGASSADGGASSADGGASSADGGAAGDAIEGLVRGDTVEVTWTPWPDVRIRTLLVAAPPWHLRIHHIVTGRPLHAVEGGWCVPWRPDGFGAAGDAAWAGGEGVHSLLIDLSGTRTPAVIEPMPGTHVLWPRTRLPVLHADLPPGEHRLGCAVLVGRRPVPVACPPALRDRFWSTVRSTEAT
jgi:hypothetical protein